MRLKVNLTKNGNTKDPILCLDWINASETLSCTSTEILRWSSTTREFDSFGKLPNDFNPTNLHIIGTKSGSAGTTHGSNPMVGQGGSGSGDLLILVTSTDGRFIILNNSNRVEKNILAHSGAIISAVWSYDCSSFLTAGEDGIIKVWSRSGLLRSTVVQLGTPIRLARWSASSSAILYAVENCLAIKPLNPNSKLVKWQAHDGLILCAAWAPLSNHIASGGEDYRYRIWDETGTILYNSPIVDEYPVTSVAFSPDSSLLLVGSFNTIRLCNATGWSYSTFHVRNVGSVFGLTWSRDGTQFVACCGNNIACGSIIKQQATSRNLRATLEGRKTIVLENILSKTKDILEFSDRVTKFCLAYKHLVVVTSSQIQVFNENYINTPIYIDGRIDVKIVELGQKIFLVVDQAGIWIYSYAGRLHLNPRYPGIQSQLNQITNKVISLGLNLIAVKDMNGNTIHVFDHMPGASRQDVPHSLQCRLQVLELALNRADTSDHQYLAFIDANRDLNISAIRNPNEFTPTKIGTQLKAILWSSDTNILAGLHDDHYSVWYCAGEAHLDSTLITITTVTVETAEFGKGLSLSAFEGSQITFLSGTASIAVSINIYGDVLHKFVQEGQWTRCLKICRMAQSPVLWGTLAAMAARKNKLDVAEEAFSAIPQIDKVSFLQKMTDLGRNNGPNQMSSSTILNGRINEAETLLLHNKQHLEAIKLQLAMFNWPRALKIAEEKNEVDRVLEERGKYLAALIADEKDAEIEETDPLFSKYKK